MDREQLKGYIDSIILKLLSRGDSYGYQMAKEVQNLSNGDLDLKDGTLYPALQRLEKAGCIEGYWVDSGSTKRKYYKITEKGKGLLVTKNKDWLRLRTIMDNVFAGGTS